MVAIAVGFHGVRITAAAAAAVVLVGLANIPNEDVEPLVQTPFEPPPTRVEQPSYKLVGTILGNQPATLGPVLNHYAPGAHALDEASPEMRLREAIDRHEHVAWIELATMRSSASQVLISPPRLAETRERVQFCAELERELLRTWGPPSSQHENDDHYWINPELSQHAALCLHGDACHLRIEAYVPVATWIDRTPASIVPIWAVGQPTDDVRRRLHAVYEREFRSADGLVTELYWKDIGLGPHGDSYTFLRAWSLRGRIVGVWAMASVQPEQARAHYRAIIDTHALGIDTSLQVFEDAGRIELIAGRDFLEH